MTMDRFPRDDRALPALFADLAGARTPMRRRSPRVMRSLMAIDEASSATAFGGPIS